MRAALRPVLFPSLEQRAKAILKRNNGTLFIPSPATCFQDSAGTTPCAVDDPIGFVRDLIGINHATQATAGYKPILRGKVKNNFKYSEELNNASWVKTTGGTASTPVVTENYSEAPDGSTTTQRIQLSLNGGTTSSDISSVISSAKLSIQRTRSGWIKTADGTTKTILTQIGGATPSHFITIGPDWTYFSNTTNDDISGSGFGLRGSLVGSGCSDSADILVWHPMLVDGSVASREYVKTTSVVASSAYGPYWMDFDGTDDRLDLSTVPIPAATAFCVVSAANPLANSVFIFSESIAIGSIPLLSIGMDTSGIAACILKDNIGTTSKATITSSLGLQKVFTGYFDWVKNNIRINSVEGTSANVAQGATTLTNSVIGAMYNVAYSNFFKGPIYALCAVKNVSSAGDMLKLEKYLAKITGVSL